MSTPGRLIALRVIALVALVASAALTADALRPDQHGFCPLEAACAAARSSPLGKVFGFPTSGIGLIAFSGLLLLTLIPQKHARAALRPAGLLSALAGVGLVGYQALVLHGFCPLCLVADAAGIAVGLAVLGWGEVPTKKGGKAPRGEDPAVGTRWALAGALAVAVPLSWPHAPERPSWVPLPESSEVAEATSPATPEPEPEPLPVAPEPTPPPAKPDYTPQWEPLRDPPKIGTPERGALAAAEVLSPPSAPEPPPAPPPAMAPAPTKPAAAAPRMATVSPHPTARPQAPTEIRLVEYLNAFCAHCRATHARLDRILATGEYPVKRRRLYVWGGSETPLWARACACAEAQGKEEALFSELLKADDQGLGSVWAAARRAGIDVAALSAAMDRGDPARLASDRQRVLASKLEGLPTLDIGRRRLEGEQSEDELVEALSAARAALPAPPR